MVEAAKYENIYLLSTDNHIYRPNGTVMEFDPDGTPIALAADGGDSQAVLAKTVTVNVVGSGIDDSDDSDSPNPVIPPVTGGGGTAIVQIRTGTSPVTGQAVAAAIDELKKSGEPRQILELTAQGGSVGLEKAALNTLAESDAQLRLSLKDGEINLSQAVLKDIAANTAGDTTFSLNKAGDMDGRPVYEITITAGGERITDFGGEELSVRVPYVLKEGEDESAVVVYYIDAGGNLRMVTNGEYRDGYVTFRTDHLSKFAVGYNKKTFTDTAGWAEGCISYLAARGIVGGVGEGRFEPDRPVTRAEFVKMLAMLSGEPLPTSGQTAFDDVDPDAWYAPCVAWAAARGHVRGMTLKTFGPNTKITREHIAVILARYAQAKNISLGQNGGSGVFSDQADISDYARESFIMIIKAGIISGRPGNICAPRESATRAESAKMLAMFLSIIINQ